MLTRLSLTSFCGIESFSTDISQYTFIQGENGSGKTHILDAIHLLSGAVPLYGASRLTPGSTISVLYGQNGLSKEFRIGHDGKRENFFVQGNRLSRPKYVEALPWRTVYISPFDMNLLYFTPSMRRDEFDMILSQAYAQFPKLRKDYELAMRQRNALLKRVRDGGSQPSELDFWDAKFAELAERYSEYRKKLKDFLETSLSTLDFSQSTKKTRFVYEDSLEKHIEENVSIQKGIILYLKKNRERDILTGHTHIGPHRDDWGFVVSNIHEEVVSVASYFSRGEMKMLLLGLKMLESEFLTKTLGLPVILLVDDIFAELDEQNSLKLLDSLRQYQVILTSQKRLPHEEKYQDFICINLQDS